MTVDPVHSSPPAIERPTLEKKLHAVPSPRKEASAGSVKVEVSKPAAAPAPSAIPEHEVKVVVDRPNNGTLVYQVLDKGSGDVVLQVPSADQLRGIHESQELLQRIAGRAKSTLPDESEQIRSANGHKL